MNSSKKTFNLSAFLRALIRSHLSALALVRPSSRSCAAWLLLLAIHALGLFALVRLAQWSLLLVAATIGILLVAAFLPRVREILSPFVLAPFFFVYVALIFRYILIRLLHGDVPGYFEYALPDPRVLLQFAPLVLAAAVYSFLILVAFGMNSRLRALVLTSIIVIGAVLGWAVTEYFGHRTFGATGSDPYAYVQMAIDLGTRGTPAHRFALFPRIMSTDLPWFGVLHVGYHLPFNPQGDAISVWSIAGSISYALAYLLGGETALYFVNPFYSLLAALVSGLLTGELLRNESQTLRLITALATTALLATSNELVVWAGVTMVDAQALVFSVLAFYCALRVYRTGVWGWALGAGVAWGVAYFVRHTQLIIVLGLLPLILNPSFPRYIRLRNSILFAAAAFIIALPDLWYHHIILGSWLSAESEELALFSFSAIPTTLFAIAQNALAAFEFGWLFAFILIGIVLYTRRAPIPSASLLLWLIAALVIQLPYAALRLRDLLPEFPILAFYGVYGMAAPIARLWQKNRAWATVLAAALIFLSLELGVLRVWNTLPRVIEPAPARFGAMSVMQRASLDQLAHLTPSNAVIGASLNSGAIDLYARRDTFRPAEWNASQLREFIEPLLTEQRAVFLLEDDSALTRVRNELRGAYHVERIATLDIPLFGDQPIENPGALWKLERQ